MSEVKVKYNGSCHCGAIKYEVWAAQTLSVIDCDCSICRKKQNRHFIVPLSSFKLMKGEELLTTYTFNTGRAQHRFCSKCGVQSFYHPRSNPDGVAIMPHCLDEPQPKCVTVLFNGSNWEQAIEKDTDIQNRSKPFKE